MRLRSGSDIVEFLSRREWQIHISRWTLLILAFSVVIIFFRVYHIQQTPAEPFSDHAEKLLDVYDVTQGQTHIFFPRNTGREAIQFYWTVLMNWIFGTGLTFLTLKIDTIGFGLFTLPLCILARQRNRRLARWTACIYFYRRGLLAQSDLPHWLAFSALSAFCRAHALLSDPRLAHAQPQRFHSYPVSSLGLVCMAIPLRA